jgi:PAS domain S-box-containing protein
VLSAIIINDGLAMERPRLRLMLCAEILQDLRHSDCIEEILETIATKLLNFLQVTHVCIYKLDKLDKSENIQQNISITGKIVAEAIASASEHYSQISSQISIESILSEEYQLIESATKKVSGAVNLAEIFVEKPYLLVPIDLSEGDQEMSLWGFLTVNKFSTSNSNNGSFQNSWDQDDVLMLQQIAMQIEIALQREEREASLLSRIGDIRHFKTMEQALRKSEASLSEAQQTAKLGNWEFNIQTNEVTWSAELFNVFERDPVLGALTYQEALDHYVPEDREKLVQAVNRTIDTGESYRLELQLSRLDCYVGDRYIEAIGSAQFDGNGKVTRLYGTAQDISDRKHIELKLLYSNTLLNLTIEHSPIGMATISLEGKFLTVNQSFCKIFGYAADELLNMTAVELTHPDFVEQTMTVLNRLVENETTSVQVEKQYIHKNGCIVDVISRLGLVRDQHDKPLQFIANVEDVTERKQTEVKLAAAKLAEAANQAKSEFLSVMSHEIRTPMNAVIGMTDVLINTPLSPQQQQYVSTIRQGGEVLLSVINNILDFSRIESGRLELEEHPFKIQHCVEEVLDLMTLRIAEKSLELFALIDLDVPLLIIGDYSRLRQILVNLVSNAIKFTSSGEIVITRPVGKQK